MEDIIFGTLASDELKVAHLRARVQGIQHQDHVTPADPQPGQAITLSVTTGPDLPLAQVVCYYTTDGTTPRGSRGITQHGEARSLDRTHVTWDNFDFNALDLNGRMRTPQLLYFLERANEELERASLEKRSFIPHVVRSVEEERL